MAKRRRREPERIPRDIRLGFQIAAAGLGLGLNVCLIGALYLAATGRAIPPYFAFMADHMILGLSAVGYWFLRYNAREPPDGPPPSVPVPGAAPR